MLLNNQRGCNKIMTENTSSDSMFHKMVLISNLYYKEKLSQHQIAKKLNISRPWVSKLLSRAEELGIVKIEVLSPFTNNVDMENALIKKYNLKYAGVIQNHSPSSDNVAFAAANYFISELRTKDIVGVGWGKSVSRLISKTPAVYFPEVQLIPLSGSFGNTLSVLPNYNTIQLAERINGIAKVFHTPMVCSQEEYRTFMVNKRTQAFLQMAEHANIILLGIGVFETSIVPQYGILEPNEIEELKQKNALGDVGLKYFDKYGNVVETEKTKLLIKADIIKASKNARTVIGIAEGLNKVNIIDVALSLNLFHAFFTDEQTASALLDVK